MLKSNVLAIIPARGGSKGLPGKNVRPLCGKPLIAWSIEQATSCPEITRTIVSTDDLEIVNTAKSFGAEVPFMRPDYLATDTASSIDVVLQAIEYFEGKGDHFDLVVLLEPTSPLRDVSDISGAIKHLLQSTGVNSVVGVSPVESAHPSFLYQIKEDILLPYAGVQPNNLRRQDIEDLYFLDGSVYVSTVASLKDKKSFYHDRTAPWVVPKSKSFEIDDLTDFVVVEALMNAKIDGVIE